MERDDSMTRTIIQPNGRDGQGVMGLRLGHRLAWVKENRADLFSDLFLRAQVHNNAGLIGCEQLLH